MAKQYTMNVSVTKQMDTFVKAKIRTGQYASASELVRELIRHAQQGAAGRAVAADIRDRIAVGFAQAESGQLIDGPAAISRHKQALRRRLQSPRRRAS